MRASRFVAPKTPLFSGGKLRQIPADNLPASSVQSPSSTRPVHFRARETQSACGHHGRGHPTRDHDIGASADRRREPTNTVSLLRLHCAYRPPSESFLQHLVNERNRNRSFAH